MNVNLSALNYIFKLKPLLVGGKAMEFYGLRKAGDDIDLIATEEDVINLIKLYPDRVSDLWGDLGVCPLNFEIWKTIGFYDYDRLKEGAIEQEDCLVISKEKLLLMRAFAIKKEKYLEDAKLVAKSIEDDLWKLYPAIKARNEELLKGIDGIKYYMKKGGEMPTAS